MKKFSGHLHVHTEYSALDGMAKIEELICKAKSLGQSFIAITDHGNSSGLYDAYITGKKHDFPVLLGEEFYFENAGESRKLGHLILIAKDQEGLSNLYQLQLEAYRNFYYKPRLNMELLKQYSSGLVCTTACIANQVNQYILAGEDHLAIGHIKELQAIFGDDLYIELQSSTMDEVIMVNKKLQEICRSYKLKPILTNDVHYVDEKDYDVHEVILAIQQQQKMDSPKRWKFPYNDYWLKSQDEMEQYVQYLDEETLWVCYDNIDEVFQKCRDVKIEAGNYLPKYKGMTKEEEDNELICLTMQKYETRIKDRKEDNREFFLDLANELAVIDETGYSGYFLIVQEYINWAKEQGILVGDGRGSGAGSKVAYTLGITEVNPQKYGLLFERFLAPGRTPDFDVDFSDIDAVYKHLQDVYGSDNVARVGAFNRFTAKSALRKVMGIYGFSQTEISKVISYMPDKLHFTLAEAIEYSPELEQWLESHKNIYHAVEKMEGIISHFSTHAGGVIIWDGLTKLLPVMIDKQDEDKLVVAYDKTIIEELGFYKFDILGLNSLTLLKDTLDYTPQINWETVDFEDENIYKMLCEGDVLGVFQLSDQADKVVAQQPKCFEDLIAINALIRPGVCDFGEYLDRRSKGISSDLDFMKSTHGLIVYQEQYLLLAKHYAGWDIAFSDKHIRKNKDICNDEDLYKKFYSDSKKRGFEEDEINNVWSEICEVVRSGYGFNRSHSTSYARLSYQTAYLKYYYPKEFYAAYMSQNVDDTDKIQEILNTLKAKGIQVLPPDINLSTDKFIPTEEGILFPLTSIKGVGGSVLYEINRMRPIASYEDFMERRIPKFVKKTAVEALIKSGAFLFTGESIYETLLKYDETAERKPDYVYEKEALGYYLSDSPFEKFDTPVFSEFGQGEHVTTIVEVSTLAIKNDKNGNEMAFITGINKTDTIKLVVFSSVWKKYKCSLGDLILIKGRKDKNSLLVNSMESIT